jgi:nucleoside-diphosphate-sugar epimerase
MSPRILLLGGHGRVSLLLTPKLLARSWDVTSVIRNPDQKAAILSAGANGPGKLDVLVSSIEDVKSEADAQKILDRVKPDWVVWSAGTLLPSSLKVNIGAD